MSKLSKPTLLASMCLIGATIAQANDTYTSPRPLHRFELMRPGSHRAVARPHAGAPLAAPAATSASTSPNFTFFDVPSSTNTEAVALNAGVGGVASHVVGCYVPNASTTGEYDGFEYTLKTRGKKSTASIDTIGPANANFCSYGVNDSGVVVGQYTPNGTTLGFVLDGTTLTALTAPFPNTCITIAAGVNDAGTIVGEYETNANCASTGGGWAEGGFLYSNGTYSLIPGPAGSIDSIPGGINSAGDVVGGALNGTESGAFAWLLHAGVYATLTYPGASYTWGTGVNDSGDVVGYYCTDTFSNCNDASVAIWHGFLYKGGVYSNIDVPGVPSNFPYGINNKGAISGEYEDTNGFWHSYVIEP